MVKMPTLYTMGHSTRPIGEFLELLRAQAITLVADVRTIPRSRHNPQYNREALEAALTAEGIGYVHLPGLGGLRHAKKDSINAGWENASFRGFADYMQTPGFRAALDELIATAEKRTAAVICAEALPWRCHRSLIADALLVRGITVMDIMGRNILREHALTPWAETDGERIYYPKPEPQAADAVPRRKQKAVHKK